ncbi:MAG: CARDB domain-containing protein [Planctomycetota bacterium]|jgi:hypothetical protein
MTITITATANGSLIPSRAEFPSSVTNGDFHIAGNELAPIVGDGSDETTTWQFGFTGDPNYPAFSTSWPLISAMLTLTLPPRNELITTDFVRIEGLPNIITPVIRTLPVGVTSTVHLQLLGLPGYASSDILGVFVSHAGQVPMYYHDDSIVSSAKLELTQQLSAFQYAVKFVCGRSAGKVVASGDYFTAINVHNPTYGDVHFRKKVATALPGEQPGPVSRFSDAKLGSDQALEIDCEDISRHAQTEAESLKGFVVIESDVELDVVAFYSAAGRDGQVETLHTERVTPRKRRVGLPDLVPVPDQRPGVGFCRLVEQGPDKGKLVVTVKNQGNADASPSITRVIFAPGGSYDIPTPSIPAGGSVDLPPLSMPAVCFNPDCDFRIIVDVNNQVVESNETNNIASGMCLG